MHMRTKPVSTGRMRAIIDEICSQHPGMLILDAQTNDCTQRMTSFSDSAQQAMQSFSHWINEFSLRSGDLWYADLFKSEEGQPLKQIASLFIEPDGTSIRLEPAPMECAAAPFGRRRGIKRTAKYVKARIFEFIGNITDR